MSTRDELAALSINPAHADRFSIGPETEYAVIDECVPLDSQSALFDMILADMKAKADFLNKRWKMLCLPPEWFRGQKAKARLQRWRDRTSRVRSRKRAAELRRRRCER